MRPVREDDLESLLELLDDIPDSITSLQPDREYLLEKIHQSLRAFYPVVKAPGMERYFFVLEDRVMQRIVGTCGIDARTGGFQPNYTYELITNHFRHRKLDIETSIHELHLRTEHEGPSELGGLFLHPDYRGCGIGATLSRSRILFAKAFPSRFTRQIMTEFRGVVKKSGHVPFWEAIGRHFFVHDFSTLDQTSAVSAKDFIADLMPRHPIYVNILPEEAREVIGKPHADTAPAVKVLEREGFQFIDQVDIFDAGPIYQATLSKTRSYQRAQKLKVKEIRDKTIPRKGRRSGSITNSQLEFRALAGSLVIEDKQHALITQELAVALEVEVGDRILFLPKR